MSNNATIEIIYKISIYSYYLTIKRKSNTII